MNDLQHIMYNNASNFGWMLYFIRRFRVDQPVVVMRHDTTHEVAVIDVNGELVKNPEIGVRTTDQ